MAAGALRVRPAGADSGHRRCGHRAPRRRRARPAPGVPRGAVRPRPWYRRRRRSRPSTRSPTHCSTPRSALLARAAAGAAVARPLGTSRGCRPSQLRRTAERLPAAGLTVLEMSRIAGIPHASVCGGRGRCSTCRVRVGSEGRASLPPASAEEQKVLARVGAPETSAWPASSGRRPAATASHRCCRLRSVRSRLTGVSRRRMAANTMSPSCSPTSAASPRSPKASCPMTWCSCSTGISGRPDRRSKRPVGGWTSSSATA